MTTEDRLREALTTCLGQLEIIEEATESGGDIPTEAAIGINAAHAALEAAPVADEAGQTDLLDSIRYNVIERVTEFDHESEVENGHPLDPEAIGNIVYDVVRVALRVDGFLARPAPAEFVLDPLEVQEAGMCPNCVTPWKCNGPHLPEPPEGQDR